MTTLLTPARATFLDSAAMGYHTVLASNAPVVGDWLQLAFTKTNGMKTTTMATLAPNLQVCTTTTGS